MRIYINSSKVLETTQKRRQKEHLKTENREGCFEIFWSWHSCYSHELTIAVATCTTLSPSTCFVWPHPSLRSYRQSVVDGESFASLVTTGKLSLPRQQPPPCSCKQDWLNAVGIHAYIHIKAGKDLRRIIGLVISSGILDRQGSPTDTKWWLYWTGKL